MTDSERSTIRPAKSFKRILAIDPTHRGFGFAVLEGPDRLVDWGVAHIRTDKYAGCMRKVAHLIEFHQPTVIVTEDVFARGSRRGLRIRKLIAAARGLAKRQNVRFASISRERIRRSFSGVGIAAKHQIGAAIAERFPELRPILPRRRKCYMSEDERMSVFLAVAHSAHYSYPRAPQMGCVDTRIP